MTMDPASSSTKHPSSTTQRNADNSAQNKQPCRFFASKSGCRSGTNCPFLHIDKQSSLKNPIINTSNPETLGESNETRSFGSQATPRSHVVPKPIPTGNPREFQLNQVRRRFSPKESQANQGTTVLQFRVVPSDPDFPYELSFLDVVLSVPSNYPGAPPTLKVKNLDIPTGFVLNIERGWDNMVLERKDATLLELVNALDRNLEVFLSMEEAKTVKLVPNSADRRHLKNAPVEVIRPSVAVATKAATVAPTSKVQTYTPSEIGSAKTQRDTQVRQLESRLGRHPLFRKSSDGIAFTLPLEPRFRNRLPPALREISTVTLYVPLLYPLQICRVKLEGLHTEDTRATEIRFEERARKGGDSLMAHLNFLSQNLHILAAPLPEEEKPVKSEAAKSPSPPNSSKSGPELTSTPDDDRSHIVHIPRPPEWDLVDSSDASDDSDNDSISSEDSEDSADFEAGGVKLPETSLSASDNVRERGTAISFPYIELFGIELLEISILNLTVKCERCKDLCEATGLRDGVGKNFDCKKCSISLAITFRKELIHANSVRAGFLDLEGCTIVDMLPSTFIPTCSQCSTPWSAGIVSVRGETTTNVCRESSCHQKFTFKIHEFKTLRISSTSLQRTTGPRRKKEVLGLVAGENLPSRGKCKHYAKSFRWFRFSCCQKTFPCDKCHDEAEDHPNEHASRMICGFCSREQNYRPEDCLLCHSVLVGKKGGGFWEGGKGTRDKVRMSRKDPRKFKRIGGVAK